MSIYSYEFNLNTDYPSAYDAIMNTGKEIGKIKKQDVDKGYIFFKTGMSFKKIHNSVSYVIKFNDIESKNLNIVLIIDFPGENNNKVANNIFAEFKDILSHFLDPAVEMIEKTFSATHKIVGRLEINETDRKLYILPSETEKYLMMKYIINFGIYNSHIYNYEDVLSFELLQDGETITSGGLGRAAAGGLIFGGAGAIVGAVTGKKKSKAVCTSLVIKITINNQQNPVEYIEFINSPIKKGSFTYNSLYEVAQKCCSMFEIICTDVKNKINSKEAEPNPAPLSEADEILKFKNLLDSGIITQEEFELKKKQILGL